MHWAERVKNNFFIIFSSFEVSQRSTILCVGETACGRPNFAGGLPLSPHVHHPVLHFRSEGQKQPRNEVGTLRLAEQLTEFEPATFGY